MSTSATDVPGVTTTARVSERSHHVCPWWMGYVLASPLRRLLESPERLLAPHIRSGARILDFGPGMGYFSIPAARLAGPEGRVVCVDIQERMLTALRRRAARAGVSERLETVLSVKDGDWLAARVGAFDLALLLHVVHEVPDSEATFAQIARALRSGGSVLLTEPAGHVSASAFQEELAEAARAGLVPHAGPALRRSRSALLQKT